MSLYTSSYGPINQFKKKTFFSSLFSKLDVLYIKERYFNNFGGELNFLTSAVFNEKTSLLVPPAVIFYFVISPFFNGV